MNAPLAEGGAHVKGHGMESDLFDRLPQRGSGCIGECSSGLTPVPTLHGIL